MKYIDSKKVQTTVKKDYSKHVIFTLDDFNQTGHLLQTVTIPPKTKQRLHVHAKQTEVYYVLNGETSIFINGREFIAHNGDAFIAEPGDSHQLWNKSDKEFNLVVFKINMPSGSDDTEWLEQ